MPWARIRSSSASTTSSSRREAQVSGLSAGVPVGDRIKKVLEMVRDKAAWTARCRRSRQGCRLDGRLHTCLACVPKSASRRLTTWSSRGHLRGRCRQLIHPDQARRRSSRARFGRRRACTARYRENGGVEQNNFDTYRVVRMTRLQAIDVHWSRATTPRWSWRTRDGAGTAAIATPFLRTASASQRCRSRRNIKAASWPWRSPVGHEAVEV